MIACPRSSSWRTRPHAFSALLVVKIIDRCVPGALLLAFSAGRRTARDAYWPGRATDRLALPKLSAQQVEDLLEDSEPLTRQSRTILNSALDPSP